MNIPIKKNMVWTLMTVFALAVLGVSASAATFTVTTTNDTQDATAGNGICADVAGACSLRAAITEANALAGADIITLPAGAYTNTLVGIDDANASGDLDITSDITINGAGSGTTIIQANATAGVAVERVIHFPNANVTAIFNDVTIRNGRQATASFGGGVRVNAAGDNVTFNNCIITNNFSGFGGGGIIINAATASVTLNNTSVTNNSAAPSTGTTQGIGGGILLNGGGTLIATNSSISNNTASSLGGNALGGGIDNAGGTITLTNTTVNGNFATTTGATASFAGGLATTGASIANISGGSVSNNTANSTGTGAGLAGGIYNEQSTLTITNSSVSGNTASSFHAGIRTLASTLAATTNITNSTISNNSAPVEGSGVINISGGAAAAITNVTLSTINGNTSSGATSVGGGIENFNTSTGAATVNLLNSTVAENSANQGGGIYNDGSAASINLNFSTVASNTAATSGGGLFQDTTAGGATNLRNSIVADNTAPTGPDIFGTITSQGYNHVEDTTGGTFTTATGDVTGSDPVLGFLNFNGGTTRNYLPGVLSPVNNTIPIGTNGCGTTVTTSQNAVTRPSETGCEKGSTERLTTTAASVSIDGRVLTNAGLPISGATVTVTDASGKVFSTRTNRLGVYRFTEMAAGETYIITPAHKRFVFAPRVVNVTEDVSELDFQAQTVGRSGGM